MNKVREMSLGDILFAVFQYVMLIGASIIALVPVVVCVLTAFKTEEEYQATTPLTLPNSFAYVENFVQAFTRAKMLRGFANTCLVLIVVLVLSVLFSSMLAYILNRFTFPGRGAINSLFTFASLIPGIATQVTVYQIPSASSTTSTVISSCCAVRTLFQFISFSNSSRTCQNLWMKARFLMGAATSACSSAFCFRS